MPRAHKKPYPSAPPPPYRQAEEESLDDKLESLSLNPQAKEFVPPESSRGPEVLQNAPSLGFLADWSSTSAESAL